MLKSIRGKLLVSHMSIFLVMVTMIFFGIIAVSNMQEKNSVDYLEVVSNHTAKMVEMEINNVAEKLESIATNQVVKKFSQSYQVPALALHFSQQAHIFSDLSYVDNHGYEELRILNKQEIDTGRDFKDSPLYLRAKENPGVAIYDNKVDIDEFGIHIHYMFGMKEYFGNQFVGVILGRYNLSLISNQLAMMDVGQGGLIILIDGTGRMLANPSGFATGGELFSNAPNRQNILNNIKEGKKFSGKGDIAGENCFLVSSPVPGVGWSVITAQPYDKFLHKIRQFRTIYLITLAGIACLGWFIVYQVSNRLTEPILSLRDQISKISHGGAEKVDLDTTGEVGELVTAFNTMVVDLVNTSVSRDFLDKIINSMNDILVVIDSKGHIDRTNIRACTALGYKMHEIKGLKLQEIIKRYDDEKKVWHEALPWLLYDKPMETELISNDGKLLPVLMTSSPFIDEKSRVNGAVLVAHDISQRKEAEEKLALYADQLQESNKELEEFAYVASHDLKEPLRKITSFGERLNLKFAEQLGERGQDYLARMESAASRMQRLIDDLLTYSRVKTKAKPFETVDLDVIAAEVVSDLETSIAERQGKVTVSELTTLNGDPTQMRQLLQNLIGNGLKFHKPDEPPEVEVSGGFLDDGYYRITIKDNGIGIEEKYAERIFGVFQRLHGRKEYEGSGIGLSVCKKIAVRHGGDITVTSNPGMGCEFTVVLDPEIKNEEIDEIETGELV